MTAAASVESYPHPDGFPADVRALFDAAEQGNVAFGAAWYRTLIDTVYAGDPGVRFFVLRRGGTPVAALPVVIGPEGLMRRTRALANYYTALHAPALVPEVTAADLQPLLAAVRAAARGGAAIDLAPLDAGAASWVLLRDALELAGWRTFDYRAFGNWYLPSGGLDWTRYLATRDAGLRSTLKRMSKRFGTDGGQLSILQRPEDAAEAIDAFETAYAASWKRPEPHPAFVPALIAACAVRGWLRMGVARLEGRAVAAQLWIVANGRAEIYKVAYDERLKQYSLGTLVTGELMRHVLDTDRVREVDYLIGDDKYKQLWMAARRERHGLIAYDLRTPGGLLGYAREAAGRAVKPMLARWRRVPAEARA